MSRGGLRLAVRDLILVSLPSAFGTATRHLQLLIFKLCYQRSSSYSLDTVLTGSLTPDGVNRGHFGRPRTYNSLMHRL